MKADIVSIGSELLMGELVDTNASYLAAMLPHLGINLQRVSQVHDDLESLSQVLREGWQRSDLILTSGGLGPTDDDVTREAIAHLLKEPLFIDPNPTTSKDLSYPNLIGGTASALKQYTLIPSARAILNRIGTAPGWWVERSGKILIAMPGPPLELHQMWDLEVEPQLSKSSHKEITLTYTFKTYGMGETILNNLIRHLFDNPSITLGIYAQHDGVHLRLRATAKNKRDADEVLKPIRSEIMALLGDNIWGLDNQTLEGEVGKILRKLGLTLSTMESITGGLLAHTITQTPGSSAYFKGGIVAYTNDLKIASGVAKDLIATYGAVSGATASAMARAITTRTGSDLGIGITGVAGPEMLENQPVGTVHIGIATKDSVETLTRTYPPQRALVKQRSTTLALVELLKLTQSMSPR